MYGENSRIFSNLYLAVIERMVSQYRNFDLFQDTLTKERDESEKFNNMLKITSKNIQMIFKTYEIDSL